MDTDSVMSESSKKLTTAKRKEKKVDGWSALIEEGVKDER